MIFCALELISSCPFSLEELSIKHPEISSSALQILFLLHHNRYSCTGSCGALESCMSPKTNTWYCYYPKPHPLKSTCKQTCGIVITPNPTPSKAWLLCQTPPPQKHVQANTWYCYYAKPHPLKSMCKQTPGIGIHQTPPPQKHMCKQTRGIVITPNPIPSKAWLLCQTPPPQKHVQAGVWRNNNTTCLLAHAFEGVGFGIITMLLRGWGLV